MDASPPKIYDIQLVINSIEVEGLPAKVLCVECCGTRMFLGTAEGYLIEFCMTDEKCRTFFGRVRQANLNKGQPVVQVRNASAIDSFIILAGSSLMTFCSQTLEHKGNSVSGVTCFAVDENPMAGDPFSVSVCFAKRKTIVVAQVTEKGINAVKEISLDAAPISLAIESGLSCVALSSGKYVFVDTMAQRKSVQDLCEFDPKEVSSKVVHVGKEEFLVIGPGGLGVFVTSRGTSERPPIIWSEKVTQLVVEGTNVVAVGSDTIYVSSLSDPGTSNIIPFPGAKCLALSEGKLYVGTARSLYRFIPISVDEQIEALLSSDKVDPALSLLDMAHLHSDKKALLFKKIHKRAIFHRMADFDLNGCRESIAVSKIDIREVISLFPDTLPSTTVFTRSLPPLHGYIDINQITHRDSEKNNVWALFLLEILLNHEHMPESEDLSTSTVKLAAKYNKAKYVTLLNDLNNLNINFDDCSEWMQDSKMFNCLALLYKARKEISQALDIWMSLLTEESHCGNDDHFAGPDVIVECLLNSNNDTLVWHYFFQLSKIDSAKALEIFTRRKPSPLFQPLEIAEKMSSIPDFCKQYLTHCVKVKKLEDEEIHTFLARLYIDEILATPEDCASVRKEFRDFLLESNHLKVQFLIGRLAKTSLRLELAILHGKAGDHAPALQIIIEELQDHEFASDYCKKIQDSDQREKAFVQLFKTYLNRCEKNTLNEECLHVMADFIEEFDLCAILPLLPDALSIDVISSVVRRAVRLKTHNERKAKVVKSLASRVHADYTVASDASNQGYQVDEESVCGICWRKFDHLEPILHSNGLAVHTKCA